MILWRLSVFCPWGTMKTTVIHCPQHHSILVSWLGFHDWLDRMLCGNQWKADQWGYHYPFIRAISRSTWEVMFRNDDMGKSHADIHLRTVLNNTEVFAPNWYMRKKVDLFTSYWNPQRKIGVATHFFQIISLESQQKCWHQHFSGKRRKQYFFTDFIRIHLNLQKSKRIYKDLKTTSQMVT